LGSFGLRLGLGVWSGIIKSKFCWGGISGILPYDATFRVSFFGLIGTLYWYICIIYAM